jgi:hypothetical protein
MSSTPPYFVHVGGEVRGPYGVEQLRELAEVGVVAVKTEAAVDRTGPWGALENHPACEVIFPARARLGFKATEIVVLNPKVTEEAAPVNVQEMIAAAEVPGKMLKLSPQQAALEPPVEKAPVAPNEVEEMVRAVREVEAKFAPPPPPPPPWRASGRLKLCGGLALLGNGVILAIPFFYGGWEDFWSMTIVKGWFVILNLGLLGLYFELPKD